MISDDEKINKLKIAHMLGREKRIRGYLHGNKPYSSIHCANYISIQYFKYNDLIVEEVHYNGTDIDNDYINNVYNTYEKGRRDRVNFITTKYLKSIDRGRYIYEVLEFDDIKENMSVLIDSLLTNEEKSLGNPLKNFRFFGVTLYNVRNITMFLNKYYYIYMSSQHIYPSNIYQITDHRTGDRWWMRDYEYLKFFRY